MSSWAAAPSSQLVSGKTNPGRLIRCMAFWGDETIIWGPLSPGGQGRPPAPQPALHRESLVMRESLSVPLLVAFAPSFFLVLASARGTDPKPATITGVCAKSMPKEANSVQDLLVARQ